MGSARRRNANLGNSKEGEVMRAIKIAYSDPKMIEISLYEIKDFIIKENIAKFILLVGSLFVGGVLSAIFSKTPVRSPIIMVSFAVFVVGLILDVYWVITKLKYLERKGTGKWK